MKAIVRQTGPYAFGPSASADLVGRRFYSRTFDDGTRSTVLASRVAMEVHLGRRLAADEHVHHRDEDPTNDDIKNLQVVSASDHTAHHSTGRASPQRGTERGWEHGTMYGWMRKRCACEACAVAKSTWQAQRNAARRKSASPAAAYGRPAEHGERLSYTRGCRCEPCRAANATAEREAFARRKARAA